MGAFLLHPYNGAFFLPVERPDTPVATTLKSQVESLTSQIEGLTNQLQQKSDECDNLLSRIADAPKEPWNNLDQMVLLPASTDELRSFEYDGNQGYGATVHFLSKRGGTPGTKTVSIDFVNNGFGNLADSVFNYIKSGEREVIVIGRHNQRDWKSPDGEIVRFDQYRAIELKDIPVSASQLATKLVAEIAPPVMEESTEEVPFA